MLTIIAARFGGQLVGLTERFKSYDSLMLKIGRDVHEANLRLLEDIERRRQEKPNLLVRSV